jgi:hypothetical protein
VESNVPHTGPKADPVATRPKSYPGKTHPPKLTAWERRHMSISRGELERVDQSLKRIAVQGATPENLLRVTQSMNSMLLGIRNTMAANVVVVGRRFIFLKETCPAGTFSSLFKHGKNAVPNHFPVSLQIAEAWMRIARHAIVGAPQYAAIMPTSWRARDELTRVDLEQLLAWIDGGEIHAEMTPGQVLTLKGRRQRVATDPFASVRTAIKRVVSTNYADTPVLTALTALLRDAVEQVQRIVTNRPDEKPEGTVPVPMWEPEELEADADVDTEDADEEGDG